MPALLHSPAILFLLPVPAGAARSVLGQRGPMTRPERKTLYVPPTQETYRPGCRKRAGILRYRIRGPRLGAAFSRSLLEGQEHKSATCSSPRRWQSERHVIQGTGGTARDATKYRLSSRLLGFTSNAALQSPVHLVHTHTHLVPSQSVP